MGFTLRSCITQYGPLPRELCPFKDDLCRDGLCPSCTESPLPLTPEQKRARLLGLASSDESWWTDEDRALFRAAADDWETLCRKEAA